MRRVLGSAALLAGGLVFLLLVAHVLFRPVNPAQQRPEPHVPGACWLCHFVSDDVELVED